MKKVLILAALIILQAEVSGQSNTQEAFIESYSLEATGNYSTAIEKIIAIYDEESYDINIRLGWLYYNLGNYPEAKKYYNKAVTILPYSLEAKLGYVLPLAGLGLWNEVIEVYNEMLKIDPQNTIANYRLGAIYYERKEFEKAFKYLENVINLYPNDYDTVVLFAWTHYQMGKLKEAKALFTKALLVKPNDSSAQYGLSLIK